jgi:hypothetical protein
MVRNFQLGALFFAVCNAASIRFEIIKRLHAIEAAVKRFAGGGAKVRCFGGVFRPALRAGHGQQFVIARIAGAACGKLHDAGVALR